MARPICRRSDRFSLRGQFAAAPLRGRAIAQVPDPGEDSEIDNGSGGRKDQHGDADRVLVKPAPGA